MCGDARGNRPAAGHVVSIVLHGPGNLLREAARIPVGNGGRYEVSGLPPGRYSVQLDGGGDLVLVSEPRFHTVELSSDTSVVADFRVLRAY